MRNRAHHIVLQLAATALLLGFASACGDDNGETPFETVVAVRAGGCEAIDRTGVGVALTGRGGTVIATSAHTVTGSDDVRIVTGQANGTTGPMVMMQQATLVGFDPTTDIALLEVDHPPEAASLADTVTVGDAARLVVRNPDGPAEEHVVTITRRLRVTIEDIFVEDTVQRRALEIDRSTRRGDSGAPVFDENASVVGIVYATSRERDAAFAVRHEELARLLDTPTIDPAATRCR